MSHQTPNTPLCGFSLNERKESDLRRFEKGVYFEFPPSECELQIKSKHLGYDVSLILIISKRMEVVGSKCQAGMLPQLPHFRHLPTSRSPSNNSSHYI
jgi:hypothetical protein